MREDSGVASPGRSIVRPAGVRGRRLPGEIAYVALPVVGAVAAVCAWQVAQLVGRRVCGMAYGVAERVGMNALGVLWVAASVILMATAGALLRGRRRAVRAGGYVALVIFVVGTVALPLLATGVCEGIPPAGRFPGGR
ncbi:Uncharacterised protein [Tsukamurella tyrosinosolvens]|uniref:Uncharacterized protein n=1 Tax=Tsukamurella tyrosinosolvens TaxID=57704 RepID=A0A1H4LVY0_TSUTY|nr:hypothetical protein SAMN04489793_0710 [Tsukamurella tyrosinosolvens]VEH88533.1 Uncharacterised protein [Tsukamurella tyrosinosolvens]